MESIGVVINAEIKQDNWIRYFISIEEEIVANISISVFNPDYINKVTLNQKGKVEVVFNSGKTITLFCIKYQLKHSLCENLQLYSRSDFEPFRMKETEILHTEESWANEPDKGNPLLSRWNFFGVLPDGAGFDGKNMQDRFDNLYLQKVRMILIVL